MEAPIRAAILAAGRGERLRRRETDPPKPLAMLGGEPLLARQARAFAQAGAEEVLAVINSETARWVARNHLALPPVLRLVVRDTANSMETLFEVGRHIAPGPFWAATVDSILPPREMSRFCRLALARTQAGNTEPSFAGVLGVTRWRGDERPLFVKLGDKELIEAIGVPSAEFVTAGVYCFSTTIFDYQERAREAGTSALRQFLAGLLGWGMRLYGFHVSDVIDIDVPEDLAAARAALAHKPSAGREDS